MHVASVVLMRRSLSFLVNVCSVCVCEAGGEGVPYPGSRHSEGTFAAVCIGVWHVEFVMLSGVNVGRCKNSSGNALFVILKTLTATSMINLSFI